MIKQTATYIGYNDQIARQNAVGKAHNPAGVGLPDPQRKPPPMTCSDEFAIHLPADLNEADRNELHLGAAINCLNDVERQFPSDDYCRDVYFGIMDGTVFDGFCTKQNKRADKSGYTLTYRLCKLTPCRWGLKDERCLFWLGQNLMLGLHCGFLNMVVPSTGSRNTCTANGQCAGQDCSAASSTYMNVHVSNRHFNAREYHVLYPSRHRDSSNGKRSNYGTAADNGKRRYGNTSSSAGYQKKLAAARQAGETLLVWRCNECGEETERLATKTAVSQWPACRYKIKCLNEDCTCNSKPGGAHMRFTSVCFRTVSVDDRVAEEAPEALMLTGTDQNSTQPQPQEQPAAAPGEGFDSYGIALRWDDPDAEFVVCSQNSHGSWNICQESQGDQAVDLDPEQIISEGTCEVITGANWIATGPLVGNTHSEEIISERLDKEREAPLSENPLWVGSDYSPGETDDDQSQDDDLLWISQELNRHEDQSPGDLDFAPDIPVTEIPVTKLAL